MKQYDILESSKGKRKLVAWLKEHVWSIIVSFTLVGSNVATISTSNASVVKQGSTIECNGFSFYINLGDNTDENNLRFLVDASPWTKGKDCDIKASKEETLDLVSHWLVDTASRSMVSYCVRFHNGGDWWADARLLRSQENVYQHQKLWDIPCASI